MIDPISAYVAYSTGRKWLPYAIGGGLGLTLGCFIAWGAWSWQGNRIDGLKEQVRSVTEQRDLASNDAKRWKVAADTARTAVELQNAEAEAARAALAQTERRLAVADAASQAEIASLSADLSKLKERARANPDQTCRLGPLDRDAVRLLVRP